MPDAINRCVEEGDKPQEKKKLTVKVVTPHDLRRTMGVQYMMGGGNIWRLHEILGHEDMNTTRKHYARYAAGEIKKRKKIIERIGNLIQVNFGKVPR